MLLSLSRRQQIALLVSTFFIAISGLIYELLAATLSSYLLGDSIFQFSLVIGLFMSAMGIGAYLSRFVRRPIELRFIQIQLMLAISGGLSAPILFFAFAYLDNYNAILWLLCLINGSLIGVEIPLIMRLLKQGQALKRTVANVLSLDYVGALFASLLFPLVFIPKLGLMGSSLFFGLLNLSVAIGCVLLFLQGRLYWRWLKFSLLLALPLLAMLFYQQKLRQWFEYKLYQDPVIFSQSTPYQRLLLTKKHGHTRLYINGNLQFDSRDEYRYHESLVHPAMGLNANKQHVLVLGGGDGMAVREVLKYPQVKTVTLVDLDPKMTDLFQNKPLLSVLNDAALQHPKVKIVNQDAWQFLENNTTLFQVIIIDLPDPHHPNISKLYSRSFYQLAAQQLSRDGRLVTQASSPLFSRQAFWCIDKTLAQTPNAYHLDKTLYTLPYHSYVPSFGEWGFVLAAQHQINWQQVQLLPDLAYLTPASFASMSIFPQDMSKIKVEINSLQTHILLDYYRQGWAKWFP